MNTATTTTDQLLYCDYLLLLSPPDDVKEIIERYKKLAGMLVGKYPGMNGAALIPVKTDLEFKQPELTEPMLLTLKDKVSQVQPVQLALNGFGYFDHGDTKTIYAAIGANDQTSDWFIKLQLLINGKPKSITPHITILRNIPNNMFEKLWPKFANSQLQHIFNIDALTILRKSSLHRSAPFKTFARFPFKGKAAAQEQLAAATHAGGAKRRSPIQLSMF